MLTEAINTIRWRNDNYLVCHDFEDYVRAQAEVDSCYLNEERWTRMSILNTLRSGKFSSDRTIQQYADEIWQIKPFVAHKSVN